MGRRLIQNVYQFVSTGDPEVGQSGKWQLAFLLHIFVLIALFVSQQAQFIL